VKWTDGPTTPRVDEVLAMCEGEGFDGMTDCATFKQTRTVFDPKRGEWVRPRLRLINTHRKLSDACELMIARAMMTEPKLLILDEPTAGVDIEIRRGMWKTLQDVNAAGTTVILTTHYLEEAESLCRNLAIIDKGAIIEQGPMKTLLAKLDVEGFVLDINGALPETLPQIPKVDLQSPDSHTLVVEKPRDLPLNVLFDALAESGITVRSMRNQTNRLEELFVRLTAKATDKDVLVPRAQDAQERPA
jgi:ABC-2 type transport system ATP-binding protein